ncbi:MAG: hypothetical protein DRG30_09845, partial [Epsilonproteobacteria bacterium]
RIITIDGIDYPGFKVKLKGTIEVPYNDCDVNVVLVIDDITNSEEETVGIYEDGHAQYETTIPYDFTEYDNISFFEVPTDALKFPRKGYRRLKFSFGLMDKSDDNIYFEAEKELFFSVEEDGYLDILERRPQIEEVAIKMTFIMGSIDGTIDIVEGKEIGNIGKLLLEDYSDDEKDEAKKRINGYISSNYAKAKSGELHIDTTINEINNLCDISTKHEIFEFCLKVAAADGVADKNEVDLAHYMADKLELDKDEYRKQFEKVLPVTMQEKSVFKNTFEKTLGIEPGISKIEINNILKKEFKKWNQRVAHSDPAKREQAELMLIEISKLRKKYKQQ